MTKFPRKKHVLGRAINRRTFIKGASMLAAGGAATLGAGLPSLRADGEDNTRFLIVLTAAGGASIIDSMMAIRASESTRAETLNCFPDQLVKSFDGSPLRAVDMDRRELGAIPQSFSANQSNFVRKHMNDIMVVTTERTSVNHGVGQRRSVTGNEAWNGRTLQELVALEHGAETILPNVHLNNGLGFTDRGTDASLPAYCFGEPITDPKLWPLSLHGSRGLRGSINSALVNRARRLRNEVIDPHSRFTEVFKGSPKLEHWTAIRSGPADAIESGDLIKRLMLVSDTPSTPLSEFGLESSPDAARVREKFPNFTNDPFDAQAAMAFLLLKNRLSVTVTLGPTLNAVINGADQINYGGGGPGLPPDTILNPPIGFDFSHQGHRSVQAMMWNRLFRVADGLIDLLKAEEYKDGESFWDRTMLYIATDFGRSKTRPAGSNEFGTGHDLNNGVVVISPMANGNTVLGGVDPETGLTYGFDPQTGTPDQGRTTQEVEVFAGLLHALDVDTEGSGLPDVRAMRRS